MYIKLMLRNESRKIQNNMLTVINFGIVGMKREFQVLLYILLFYLKLEKNVTKIRNIQNAHTKETKKKSNSHFVVKIISHSVLFS